MRSRLPIEALRAFVRAAELGSFRAAAASLHLTPGALSQRIAELERFWGCSLFDRRARGVSLSAEGRGLFDRVADPLKLVEQVLSEPARSQRRRKLRIHTVAAFANQWLVPRLDAFSHAHPAIDIQIETGTQLADLLHGANAPDIAIRYGRGNYEGLMSIELMRPSLMLVIRPDLLEGEQDRSAEHLLRSHRLLRERDTTEWRRWLEPFDISENEASWGLILEDDAASISAALSGQGIASVRSFYADGHLDCGELVPIAERADSVNAYFLVGLAKRFKCPEVIAFRNWIFNQMQTG